WMLQARASKKTIQSFRSLPAQPMKWPPALFSSKPPTTPTHTARQATLRKTSRSPVCSVKLPRKTRVPTTKFVDQKTASKTNDARAKQVRASMERVLHRLAYETHPLSHQSVCAIMRRGEIIQVDEDEMRAAAD